MKARVIHKDFYGHVSALACPPEVPPIDPTNVLLPIGTIIENPDAWKLVQLGACEAADDECAQRALTGAGDWPGISRERIELAREHYPLLQAGCITGLKRFDAKQSTTTEGSLADD